MEVWKKIKGYDNYLINNDGDIFSLNKNKILKTPKGKNGYFIANLYNKGKIRTVCVHKLVAETFIKNNNHYPCINHIDGNKLNNRVENLEWCTYSHNTKEAFRLGLQTTWTGTKFGKEHPNYKFRGKWKTQKPVAQYDKDNNLIKKFNSACEVERILNISMSHISECCKFKRKSAGGYIWRYID